MTDIVDRLRANAAYWRSEHGDIAEDLRRAADEIERLPDTLQRITLNEAVAAERAAILEIVRAETVHATGSESAAAVLYEAIAAAIKARGTE
jgi:hypothetical protein